MTRFITPLLTLVFLLAIQGILPAQAPGSGFEPVEITGYSYEIVELDCPVTRDAKEYSHGLKLLLRGRNFHARALDPLVTVGTREIGDYRILPGEQEMEITIYDPDILVGASSVAVGYPGTEAAVLPLSLPAEAIARLRSAQEGR